MAMIASAFIPKQLDKSVCEHLKNLPHFKGHKPQKECSILLIHFTNRDLNGYDFLTQTNYIHFNQHIHSKKFGLQVQANMKKASFTFKTDWKTGIENQLTKNSSVDP